MCRPLLCVLLPAAYTFAGTAPKITTVVDSKTAFQGQVFDAFSFPQVDRRGVVAYDGTTNASSGIYGAANQQIVQFVSENSSFPTAQKAYSSNSATFNGGTALGGVSGDSVSFIGGTSSGEFGVFVSNGEEHGIQQIADPSTPVPSSSNATFSTFYSPSLDVTTNTVAFRAKASGDITAGVFAAQPNPTGKSSWNLHTIADTNTPVPGSNGTASFSCFDGTAAGAGGHVAFFASQCTQNAVKRSTLVRTRRAAAHALNTGHVDPGVYLSLPRPATTSAAKLSTIADWRTPVPGGYEGETFTAFSLPSISQDGASVAFVGLGTNNTMGVYLGVGGGRVCMVADSHTVAPGAANTTFGDFPEVPSVAVGGAVAFYSVLSSGNTGMYLSAGGCSNGALRALVTESTEINGQLPIYIGFGGNAFDGRNAAFYAVLADQTLGVYTVDAASAGMHGR